MIVLGAALETPNFPRFCYENVIRDASVTVSSEATGFEGTNTQNALTWNFWRPNSLTATIDYDIGSQTYIDFCGIAAHNLGTKGATVTLQSWDGDSWETIDDHTPTDDSTILFLFPTSGSTKFRLSISGSSVPDIGVVYMGEMLTSERGLYGGHTPITLSKRTVVRPNTSEGGQWLGRSKIREGFQTNISLRNLTADWIRNSFEPFMDSAIDYPFFFAWRPTEFPNEVAYCWTEGDIVPSNSGKRDLMDVEIPVKGVS